MEIELQNDHDESYSFYENVGGITDVVLGEEIAFLSMLVKVEQITGGLLPPYVFTSEIVTELFKRKLAISQLRLACSMNMNV